MMGLGYEDCLDMSPILVLNASIKHMQFFFLLFTFNYLKTVLNMKEIASLR